MQYPPLTQAEKDGGEHKCDGAGIRTHPAHVTTDTVTTPKELLFCPCG